MRLPLIRPDRLTTEQQPLYSAMTAMVEGEEYAGFEIRNADGAFVGPWGVMLHFPELAQPVRACATGCHLDRRGALQRGL
jgi:4-carboxymuconolactone decarboxylase